MKKAILLIIAVSVLLNFNALFAQDQNLNNSIGALWRNLNDNHEKLKNMLGDSLAIAKSIQNDETQVNNIIIITHNIINAMLVHKYLIPVVSLSSSVREDNLLYYYKVVYGALLNLKFDLNYSYNQIQNSYPLFRK